MPETIDTRDNMFGMMLGAVSVSRNRGEEAIQEGVELFWPLPVKTMSGFSHANWAAVPEVPERQNAKRQVPILGPNSIGSRPTNTEASTLSP